MAGVRGSSREPVADSFRLRRPAAGSLGRRARSPCRTPPSHGNSRATASLDARAQERIDVGRDEHSTPLRGTPSTSRGSLVLNIADVGLCVSCSRAPSVVRGGRRTAASHESRGRSLTPAAGEKPRALAGSPALRRGFRYRHSAGLSRVGGLPKSPCRMPPYLEKPCWEGPAVRGFVVGIRHRLGARPIPASRAHHLAGCDWCASPVAEPVLARDASRPSPVWRARSSAWRPRTSVRHKVCPARR